MTYIRSLLKRKLSLDYEAAVKAADHALVLRYDTAKGRASEEGNGYHVGYRSGRFEENQRLEKYHEAIQRFVGTCERLAKPGGAVEAALNLLLEEIK